MLRGNVADLRGFFWDFCCRLQVFRISSKICENPFFPRPQAAFRLNVSASGQGEICGSRF